MEYDIRPTLGHLINKLFNLSRHENRYQLVSWLTGINYKILVTTYDVVKIGTVIKSDRFVGILTVDKTLIEKYNENNKYNIITLSPSSENNKATIIYWNASKEQIENGMMSEEKKTDTGGYIFKSITGNKNRYQVTMESFDGIPTQRTFIDKPDTSDQESLFTHLISITPIEIIDPQNSLMVPGSTL